MTRAGEQIVAKDPDKVIKRALARNDLAAADAAAKTLTPAQTVDVLERLPATQRAVLYRLLPKEQASAVFEELQPVLQKDLISSLRDEEVAVGLKARSGIENSEAGTSPFAARITMRRGPCRRLFLSGCLMKVVAINRLAGLFGLRSRPAHGKQNPCAVAIP